MKALVTGSTGFVGAALVKALVQAGHKVYAFHRANSLLRLLEGLDVERITGDLTSPESLQGAMEGVDVVFHAAAWMYSSEPERLNRVTVEGARAVFEAAAKTGVKRVVHTSSVAALGVPETDVPSLLNENHTWNFQPAWYPYGYAKYLAEVEAQRAVARGLDVVIVNPSLVFGAGDIHRQTSSIINQVARRKVTVAVEGGLNVAHIDDVAAGHLAALERGKRGERYILGGENLSVLELVGKIAEVTGVPAPTRALPAWLARLVGGVASPLKRYLDLPVPAELFRLAGKYFYYDLRKSQVELGLPEPQPAERAIRDAWEWFGG